MNPDAKKHKSNSRVIPAVPMEIHQNPRTTYPNELKKFKSVNVARNIPLAMTIGNNNRSCSVHASQPEFKAIFSADKVEDLQNDAVLNYTLNRVLYLREVLTSVDKKCNSRAFDILNFPFSDIKKIVTVIHSRNGSGTSKDESELFRDMNRDCLFCQEINNNVEKYSAFVDFNVNEELKKFSESGWFNSSLGDFCVWGCSNLWQMPVVAITSLAGSPVLTFMPFTLLSTSSIYIAYDRSSPGDYDATKSKLVINTVSFRWQYPEGVRGWGGGGYQT